MATIRLYLDIRRVKANGEYPIKVVVNHRGKIMISTPYSVKKSEWRSGRIVKSVPNSNAKNAMITKMVSEIESKMLDLDREGRLQGLSNKKLKEVLQSKKTDKPTLFIETFRIFAGTRQAERTQALYRNTLSKVLQFDPEPTFENINFEWLEEFEQHLRSNGDAINTIAIELRNIRAVFNYALKKDLTNIYPFRKFGIKKEETRHRDLELCEMQNILKYDGKWNHFRDCFMLSFYLIGINLKDLLFAKKKDIKKDRLEYRRSKTKKLYSIKIEPEAQEIINRYPDDEYMVSFIRMYKDYDGFKRAINYALKKLTDVQGSIIDETMSTYHARHSWATIASDIGILKDTISEALGHKYGSQTTGIYIDFDTEKIDQANRKVIDAITQFNIKQQDK